MLSLRELGSAMRAQNKDNPVGSKSTVQRVWKEQGYRRVRVRSLPLLTQGHKKARLEWATVYAAAIEPFGDDSTIYMNIDEKWFYAVRIGQMQWRGRHEKLHPIHLIHRSHVVKEMFLAAVARPIATRRFAGNIGIWPVTATKTAKHSSKNHKKGDEYLASTSMDASKFKDMLCTLVLPAALKAGRGWAKKIIVQMDNAVGHGGGSGNINNTTIPALNAWISDNKSLLVSAWGNDDLPQINFITQPARSPDCNVLDLGAWNSLQTTFEKLQIEHLGESVPIETLRQRVQESWSKWSASEKLNSLLIHF